MTVVNAWCGAPTPGGVTVAAKVTGASVRLAVSTQASLSDPVYTGPVAPAGGFVKLTATGLEPGTRYWWAIEEDGVLNSTYTGQFRTLPIQGTAASFTIAVAGDAGLEPLTPGVAGSAYPDRISNDPIFDTIRAKALAEDHLMFVHLGDMHYYNPGQIIGSTVADYRTCIDDVLLQPRQHELYRNVPVTWIWDDHDYGPNDSDSTHTGRANAWQVYRERVPSYPLADPEAGCHHAFQIGRVLFIAWDYRSFKSPKGDTDDASKTALGASQKAWMRALLETTDAEALVVLQQTAWAVPPTVGSDAWGGYNTERTELANMFAELGWADRMVMAGADVHSVAIDSGANNNYGGFPHALLAPLDANPSGTWENFDTVISNEYRQYGTIGVDDDGDRIRITITGWRDTGILGAHTLDIPTPTDPGPGPEPEPAPPQVGRAVLRSTVEWIACDVVTGNKVAYLSGITGTISRALGAYTSDTLTVPAPLAGPLALGGLLEQSVGPDQLPTRMIVCIVNDLPAWAGLIWKVRGGTGATIELGCATPESYLDRRYIGDMSFTQTDQASIAAAMIQAVNVEGINLELDAPATGVLRDRVYWDDEDATYYQRLTELMNVEDGLEWTIDLDWRTDRMQSVRMIFRAGQRLGSTTPRGPLSTQSKAVTRYEVSYDYGKGMGANDVLAYSSGEGQDRPQSQHIRNTLALEQGIPRVEHRWSPSSSIKETATLNAHATSELYRLDGGTTSLAVTSRWNIEPARLGIDLELGDDIAYALVGHMHPTGLTGTARMVGYRLDPLAGTFEPVLRI